MTQPSPTNNPVELLIQLVGTIVHNGGAIEISEFESKNQELFDRAEIELGIHSQYFWMCCFSGRVDNLVEQAGIALKDAT